MTAPALNDERASAGRPTSIRYLGSIRPLHALWEIADRLGLRIELARGTAPHVLVVVHDHLLADGAERLHELLATWRAEFAHLADLELTILDAPGPGADPVFVPYGRQ